MRLITHVRPHLDDVCALWLLKRYLPGAKDAVLDFIPTGSTSPLREEQDGEIYVGVNRGRFDEHKGDIGETATTLVWKHLQEVAPPAAAEASAVSFLVEWVRSEDLGLLKSEPHRSFAIPSLLDGFFEANGKDSQAVTEFGFLALDALLQVQRGIVELDGDWEHRTEFVSRFGRGVAFTTDSRYADTYGYERGFAIVALFGKSRPYFTIRGPAGSGIDLTSAHDELRKLDPAANWYLHHSKQMLISGGERAPGEAATTLPRQTIIDALE